MIPKLGRLIHMTRKYESVFRKYRNIGVFNKVCEKKSKPFLRQVKL